MTLINASITQNNFPKVDAEVKQEFNRLHAKLNALLASAKKETWIGPGWLKKLTGWNREEMRQAREQKIIEFKPSDGGGWLYKLESVPEGFIKKQTA